MALRANLTRQRASRWETVVSLPIRLSVSSTIMRIRRSLRRSKNAERTSTAGSISNLPMLSCRGETAALGGAFQRSGVFPIPFRPDLLGQAGIDSGLVVFDGRAAHRAHGDVVQRAAGNGA